MPRNEEGEFELVLGNRQLLSVFFIVVVLLGVFFTMGYIVGRNSSPVADVARRTESAQTPIVVDAPKPAAETPLQQSAPPSEAPKPTSGDKPTPGENALGSAPYAEPPKGTTFLQVMAVPRADAEMMVNILRKKGFPALVASGPSESQYRVLVGPLADSAAIAKTRDMLAEAGFKGAIVRKY